MVCTVARHVRWNPEVLKNLYLDDIDFDGLEFWYKDAEKASKEVTDKINKK